MIVLSRQTGQSIVIDHDIRVTVVQINGDRVRLGIEAPRERRIHRSEVAELIREVRRETDARVRVTMTRLGERTGEVTPADPWAIDGPGYFG